MKIEELNSDIKYLFDKYNTATYRGKANSRALGQLVTALSVKEIYLSTKKITV